MLTISREAGKLNSDDAMGAKLVAFLPGHGRACPGRPDNSTLRHRNRDRREKAGDGPLSFAPVMRRPASSHCQSLAQAR
jgi:hypothetical protein